MKSTVQRIAIAGALSLSLGLGLAGAAGAQGRPPAPQTPQAQGPQPPRPEGQRSFEDMQHRREQRLHDLLQIKPDQEGAFRTFVAALQQLRPERRPGDGRAFTRRPQERPETTTERLDRALQRATEAQQRLQKASTAVKTFYAVLSPEQRKAFDTLPILVGGEGRFGHGRMFMRGRFDGGRFDGGRGFGPPPVR